MSREGDIIRSYFLKFPATNADILYTSEAKLENNSESHGWHASEQEVLTDAVFFIQMPECRTQRLLNLFGFMDDKKRSGERSTIDHKFLKRRNGICQNISF